MADRVKGITVEIGGDVTGLNKALAGTNKEIKSTQSQLKDVEKLLKLDPTNTTLLEQKQRLLADAVGETKSKLDTLKKTSESVTADNEKYEEWQKAFSRIQQQVTKTTNKLNDLKESQKKLDPDTAEYSKVQAEIEKTQKKLEDLDKKAKDTFESLGKPISVDQYDTLQREIISTELRLKDLGKTAKNEGEKVSNLGDYLKANAIVEGVKGIAGAISDLSEETQEYRKIMGTLETSSEQAGYTAQQTAQTYKQLYGVLGDDQTTATTVANLQALELSQGKLTQLTDAAIGAWAKYGDSIPIDGLAEAINETIRGGTVTGNFADVLNWGSKEGETFGVMLKENTKANEEWNKAVEDAETAEDYFNLALQNCSTEAERANLVLQAMTDQGLVSAADAWRKNNEDIVAANEAQSDFMEKAAELSERVAPAIQAVKEGGNDLLQLFLDLTSEVDFDAIAETINQVFAAVEGLITFLVDNQEAVLTVISAIAAGLAALKLAELISTISQVTSGVTTLSQAFPLLGNAISILTNPIFLVTAAVVALVALIATKGDEIQAILQKVDDWLQGVFAKDWTEIFGPLLGESLNAFFAIVKDIWDSVKQIFDGVIDFIRGVFTGDWERAWNGVVDIFGGIFSGIAALTKAPFNLVLGMLNTVINAINTLISGLNKIHFNLPSWLGGGSFGINLPSIPNLPYLAKGGIVEEGSAIVGDAGPELLTVSNGRTMVQPLPGNTGKIESLLGSIDSRIGGQGELTIVVPVSLNGRIIGEETYRYIQNRGRANG